MKLGHLEVREEFAGDKDIDSLCKSDEERIEEKDMRRNRAIQELLRERCDMERKFKNSN